MVRTAQMISALQFKSNGSQSWHVRTVQTAQLIMVVKFESKGSRTLWVLTTRKWHGPINCAPFDLNLTAEIVWGFRMVRTSHASGSFITKSDGSRAPKGLVERECDRARFKRTRLGRTSFGWVATVLGTRVLVLS